MRFLMKEKCCCGVDLKLGGLIVASLDLGLCILDLIYFIRKGLSYADFIGEALAIVAVIACIYGICKDKHLFMLPYLILSWVFLVILGLALIIIPFGGSVADKMLNEILAEYKDKFLDTDGEGTGTVRFIFWITIAIFAAITLYATIVLQSLYKLIKEYGHGLLPTANRCEFQQTN